VHDLDTIIRVVGVRRRRGTAILTWFGSKICELDSESAVGDLERVLYRWAYTPGTPIPREPEQPAAAHIRWHQATVDPRLRAWWNGWYQQSTSNVRLDGQPIINCNAAGLGRGPIALSLPALSHVAIPGWLLVRHGDVSQIAPDPYRVYVNTDPDKIIALLPVLSGCLVDHLPAFSAKFLTTHDHRLRTDSTVIYLPEIPGRDVIGAIISATRPAVLRATVPMFTQRIASGVALAPSPPDARSYGMDVCARIAEQIVNSYRGSDTSTIAATWAPPPTIHVDLESGNCRAQTESESPVSVRSPRGSSPPRVAIAPIDQLGEFTRYLAREALTSRDHVTWLSLDNRFQYRTLGASVYDGLSGPLLVLANAVALTGDRDARRLLRAVGNTMLTRQPELSWLGFHTGQFGTAAALAEAAQISGECQLVEQAVCSLERALHSVSRPPHEWDIISGVGGALVALAAAGILLERHAPDVIADLRARLRGMWEPDKQTNGVRWRMRTGSRSRALAGLAHGGTGAALALVVGGPAANWAVDLARRSVQFEDQSRTDGHDWLDYRVYPLRLPAFAWCHGAAGIGVGTAAIIAQNPNSLWNADLRSRIRVAAARTLESLNRVNHDDGLCHGASGQALALCIMAESSGQPLDRHQLLEKVTQFHDRPAMRDLTLMNGESGRLIARLVLSDLADPPLTMSLVPRLPRSRTN
jgi:hypothetical protein